MGLELTDLKKTYIAPDGQSVPVIDLATFKLGDGEQVALVGGSGTGKTTLLHLIAGILAPDAGRVVHRIDGQAVDVGTLGESGRDLFRGRNIGYIFQTHHLLPGFTALENVLLGMSFTGRSADTAWAKKLLTEVGLAERFDFKPDRLSVGQQQRVAVARALANRPKLVLADEPTGALDPKSAQQVLALIRQLCTEVGAALLIVSHDPAITSQFSRVIGLAEINRVAA